MSKNATERSREKSGFQVCCTDVGGIGCDQNVEEGKQWLVTYNEQKSRFFCSFLLCAPLLLAHRSTPIIIIFHQTIRQKPNSLRLVVRTHVRDFFYHNEERFCACFKHPPLTRLSPRSRSPPPHYIILYTYT